MKKFVAHGAQTLRDFTDENYPQGSFAFSRLLREREVRVNGKKTGENVMLRAGDEIEYFTTRKEEERPFYNIVYEDENVLVADKYAGVNAEGLASHLAGACGARAVHLLDRNTAGLTAFAKTESAEAELLNAFRTRRVQKEYEAVCFRPFAAPHALLSAYLQKDARAARVSVYAAPRAGAEPIRTEYFVEKDFGEYSLVRILLHSGKTHQIRAHMAFAGHPVAGDEKYGDEALNKKYGVRRHILVAKSLCFDFGQGALSYLNGKKFFSSFAAQMPQKPQGK